MPVMRTRCPMERTLPDGRSVDSGARHGRGRFVPKSEHRRDPKAPAVFPTIMHRAQVPGQGGIPVLSLFFVADAGDGSRKSLMPPGPTWHSVRLLAGRYETGGT